MVKNKMQTKPLDMSSAGNFPQGNEPAWLEEFRQRAREAFEKLQLEKSRYTPLRLDFDNTQPSGDVLSSVSPVIPSIIFTDINSAIAKHPQLLQKIFAGRLVGNENKLTAWNNLLFNNGLFVYVPAGVSVGIPLSHKYFFDGANVFTQTILVAEPNSSVTLIEEPASRGTCVHNSIIEIHARENANVTYSNIQTLSEDTTNLSTIKINAEANARVKWLNACFGSGLTKATRSTILAGPGAELEDLEVFFGKKKQHFDLSTNVTHSVPNCISNVYGRGILDDQSRCVSHGLIKINKGAKGTNTYLSLHALMLNKEARADPAPFLEIDEKDVRAGHSASASPVDVEQLYYLTSRGLSVEDARTLIVLGFLEPVIARLQAEGVKARIHKLIEEKWAGV